MRIRFSSVLSAVALLIVLGVIGSRPVSAEVMPGQLSADITAKSAATPNLRLKNTSSAACQVATTAHGTVAITKVLQGDKALSPQILDIGSDEDVGYTLKSQLKTLKPGDAVDIPLDVYKLKSGSVLRSTTWSSDGSVFGSQYQIQPNQPLQLELNYSLPASVAQGDVPVCGAVFTSTVAANPWVLILLIASIVIVAAIVIILFLAWWLRRRDHRKTPVVAAAIVAAAAMTGMYQAPAYADIVVPPDMQSAFDGCMSTFEANRDITGPVLDVINNPANHIEVVRTTGGSDMTGYDHTFTIYWNPDDHHHYDGTGGDADPCTTLYHEMYHALDMSNGTFSRDDCAGSGIETKEVMATRAQNALRVRLGMPARSHYGSRPLPSGDCTQPSNPAQCTGEHCGETNGDPHLLTFDGLRYDFQGAGEFVAARNASGDYEIQVRQEPWVGSRIVAINTATAMKVDGDRLEVRAGAPLQLLVNGKTQSLEATSLPGGGQVEAAEGIVTITWKDGSKAYVRAVGSYGLALSVQPADSQTGKLEGLLGDANGEAKNDLHLRGSDKTIQANYEALYPSFADSWRISDSSSLFSYEKGKTTGTYTDKSFPDRQAPTKDITGYNSAEAYCKSLGISDPVIVANCALDLSLTGRPEFAKAAVHSQSFAAGALYGGTTWQLAIKNSGDSANVTFDGKAGEKVFVSVPQSNLPNQCGVLTLRTPDDYELTSGCIINGSGYIDGTVLPDSGQYTIRLAPGGPVGTALLRLIRITDKQSAITPDGDAITATIDKPGVVGRYTFNGKAGQLIYLDVPKSTLGNQCGILRLLGPDNAELASGCIINTSGNIDTVRLPSDGRYTVIVDPNDLTVGMAQLHLIAPTAEVKPIVLDGSTLTARLSKPGSTATFTFNGSAGQRIYVDLPTSDLPSRCGVLRLVSPDGNELANGCIINYKGNLNDDGVVLPTSGSYSIVLDPSDAAVGNTTIRLRSR